MRSLPPSAFLMTPVPVHDPIKAANGPGSGALIASRGCMLMKAAAIAAVASTDVKPGFDRMD